MIPVKRAILSPEQLKINAILHCGADLNNVEHCVGGGGRFLTRHSAPGAEVGFSERLLLVCEVPGPGKAARGSEGGGVATAPPGFIGQKIPLEGPKMVTAVIFEICLEQSTRHQELK